MLTHPQRTYLYSEDDVRRTINDALYEAFYLDAHGFIAETRMQPAFEQIVEG